MSLIKPSIEEQYKSVVNHFNGVIGENDLVDLVCKMDIIESDNKLKDAEISNLKKDNDILKQNIIELSNEISRLRISNGGLEISDMEKLINKKQSLELEIKTLEEKIPKIKQAGDLMNAVQREYETLRTSYKNIMIEKELLQKENTELKESNKLLESQSGFYSSMASDTHYYKNQDALKSHYTNFINVTKEKVMSIANANVNDIVPSDLYRFCIGKSAVNNLKTVATFFMSSDDVDNLLSRADPNESIALLTEQLTLAIYIKNTNLFSEILSTIKSITDDLSVVDYNELLWNCCLLSNKEIANILIKNHGAKLLPVVNIIVTELVFNKEMLDTMLSVSEATKNELLVAYLTTKV
jgi:hypothetical protein